MIGLIRSHYLRCGKEMLYVIVKTRCGTNLLFLMCVMNLVHMWCVINTAYCVEIAVTSIKLIWSLLYLISATHLIAIKVIDRCKTQTLLIIKLIRQYVVMILDCLTLPLNHRTDQHLAMEGQSDFLPSIEILWCHNYICDKPFVISALEGRCNIM